MEENFVNKTISLQRGNGAEKPVNGKFYQHSEEALTAAHCVGILFLEVMENSIAPVADPAFLKLSMKTVCLPMLIALSAEGYRRRIWQKPFSSWSY